MTSNAAPTPVFPLSPLRLAVLISGGGSTLKNLLDRIAEGSLDARIELVISSSSQARGLQYASDAGVATKVVARRRHVSDESFAAEIFDACRSAGVHLVAMAGFLKFAPIPADFVGRVMNIHPSLIPAFCGHGMYGRHVHEAVLSYGCKISGCTVHFVDNQYDNGPIILQRTAPACHDDTPESLAARVFAEECAAYPEALRLYAAGRLKIEGRRVCVARE